MEQQLRISQTQLIKRWIDGWVDVQLLAPALDLTVLVPCESVPSVPKTWVMSRRRYNVQAERLINPYEVRDLRIGESPGFEQITAIEIGGPDVLTFTLDSSRFNVHIYNAQAGVQVSVREVRDIWYISTSFLCVHSCGLTGPGLIKKNH